jgi:DNA-binding response OmpR family regulator
VLLAEHQPEVAELARRYLARAGLEARVAADPDETTAALAERWAAVAVLDLTMPGLDARRLRRLLAEPRHRANGHGEHSRRAYGHRDPADAIRRGHGHRDAAGREPSSAAGREAPAGRMPAVFLLGNGMRPRDLRVSADSCLTRPFSPRLLVAKVQAAVSRPPDAPRNRRAARAAGTGLSPRTVGALTLDPATGRVSLDGRDVALTPTEFALLAVLAEQAGRVMSRDRLLTALGDRNASGRAVDVYVAQVRAKLGAAAAIRTVRGVGYALDRPALGPAPDGPAPDEPVLDEAAPTGRARPGRG